MEACKDDETVAELVSKAQFRQKQVLCYLCTCARDYVCPICAISVLNLSTQGRAAEAIELLERALEIEIGASGAESCTVQKLSDHLCDILNGCALKHLQNGMLVFAFHCIFDVVDFGY